MARFDELDLPDDEGPGLGDAADAARALLDDIHDMLGDHRWEWARDTLEGIAETVERTQRVSDRQQRAVGNIRAKVEERADEGFRSRGRSRSAGGRWLGKNRL